MKILEDKPPMVNYMNKWIYDDLAVLLWECPNAVCGARNTWRTRQSNGYVTLKCNCCRKIVSLNKYDQ